MDVVVFWINDNLLAILVSLLGLLVVSNVYCVLKNRAERSRVRRILKNHNIESDKALKEAASDGGTYLHEAVLQDTPKPKPASYEYPVGAEASVGMTAAEAMASRPQYSAANEGEIKDSDQENSSMGKPTEQELQEALHHAALMRETGADEHYIAKAILNLNYRNKKLEKVLEHAERYLRGEDPQEHSRLVHAIEEAKKAGESTEDEAVIATY